jgi:hypothetical protein
MPTYDCNVAAATAQRNWCTTFQVQHQKIKRNVKNKSLKGQSHEEVGEMRVQGDSLGPN